jgi:hypothetical protein
MTNSILPVTYDNGFLPIRRPYQSAYERAVIFRYNKYPSIYS